VPKIIDVLMLKLLDLTPSQFDSSVIPVALGLKLLPEKKLEMAYTTILSSMFTFTSLNPSTINVFSKCQRCHRLIAIQ